MPATQNAAFQHAQSMIQDYSQALQPLIADTLQNCFVAVQKHPRHAKATELVTLNAKNGLMWLFPDATSLTGFAHSTSDIFGAPTDPATRAPLNPSRLLPFYQRDVLYVFAEFDLPTGSQIQSMQWTEDGGWAEANIADGGLQLLSTMGQSNLLVDDDGRGFLYGVTATGFPSLGPVLIVLGTAPRGLQINKVALSALNVPTTATVALLPAPGKDSFILLTLDVTLDGTTATFQPIVLNDGEIQSSGPASAPQPLNIPGPLQAVSVVPVPDALTSLPTFLLLSQSDQQLYAVTGNGLNGTAAATARPLTSGSNQPAGVSSVSAGTEAGGDFAVFAIDTTASRLWTFTQPTGTGAYAWVPLGNTVIAMTAPIAMAGASEVLLCDQSLVISRLTQTQSTDSWYQLPVMTPSPPSQPITETATYTQQFSLKAANGTPMPHTSVKLYSNPQQVVIINSIAYHASPSQPVTVTTDAFGTLTVATVTTGLASPVLTIECKALGEALGAAAKKSYRGDTQLHQRMNNQNSDLQINGPWLIQNNILPANTSSSDAANYASTMTSLAGCAVNMAAQPGAAAQTMITPCNVLINVNQGQLQCQPISSDEFARLFPAADSVLGDVWGDVANFCKNAWNDIEHIVVTIAEDTAQIAVKLYDKTVTFVLTTIEDIRNALEVMIAFIAKIAEDAWKLIKDFIALLKLLFDWDNILNTKTVIEHFVTQLLGDMQDSTTAAQTWIQNQFATANKDISAFFTFLDGIVDPTLTFGQAAASQSSATAPAQAQIQANAIQSNYGWSKVLMAAPIPGGAPTDIAETVNPALKDFLDAFEQVFGASASELKADFAVIVAAAQQIHSVSSFLDFVIVALLEACQAFIQLVMNLIQDFLVTVLGVMASVAQYLTGRLTDKIEIPVLSAIYRVVAKSEMTLLDMMCLVIAIPVTVVYELVNGAAPFDSKAVGTITGTTILWPWSPGFQHGGGNAEVISGGPAIQVVLSWVSAAAGGCYTACDIYCDWVNTGMTDADEEGGERLVKWASTLSLLTNIIVTVSGAPWFAPAPADSPAAGWQLGTFAAAMPPLITDGLFLEYTTLLSRFGLDGGPKSLNPGPLLSSVFGAAQVAVGSTAAYAMGHYTGGASYSGWDKTAAVLSGFSNLGKSFTYLGEGDDPEGIAAALIFLSCFDAAGDLGGAFTALFATYD